MANRQRSFFGSTSKKPKPSFNRANTTTQISARMRQDYQNQDNSFVGDNVEPLTIPRHPIEPSTESRRKLQTFQFTPKKAAKLDSGPQGEIIEIDLTDESASETTAGAGIEPSEPIHSTPTPRLPITDLVGHPESSYQKLTDFATQVDEQLSWGPSKSSLYEDLGVDLNGNLRKRPRSSSPINSRDESNNSNTGLDPSTPFSLRRKSQTGRTPFGDSFTDLWDHYGMRSEADGRESLSRPTDGRSNRSAALQNLLDNCSSPLSPANSGRISGLRRWASCVTPTRLVTNRLGPKLLPVPSISSSEYDEMDVDGDTLKEMVSASQVPPSAESRSSHNATSPLIPHAIPYPTAHPQTAGIPVPEIPNVGSITTMASTTATDEFDDSEFFSDDLGDLDDIEDLVSLVNASTANQQWTQPLNPPPQPVASPLKIEAPAVEPDFDDEFGGDDFDLDDMISAATQSSKPAETMTSNSLSSSPSVLVRYAITAISEGNWANCFGNNNAEKICVATVIGSNPSPYCQIHLRQSWYETPVTLGAIVHIIGNFDSRGVCIIDNVQGILILHPDNLLSSTHISDTFTCMRRAVLQSRVKATSQSNVRLMYGNILHQLLQEAMTANKWDSPWLLELLELILPTYFSQMVEIGAILSEVRNDIQNKIPLIQQWGGVYLGSRLTSKSKVNDHSHGEIPLIITRLLDIEEHVWSPRYGLKGNVDATVEALVHDGTGEKILVMPFELKTGKGASINHRAQTALYTLLLSDRYDVDINHGLLSYLERSETNRVTSIRNEIIHMLINRNELASYIAEKKDLPPVLKDARICDMCYSQRSCFTYHKLTETDNGMGLSDSARSQYQDLFGLLSPEHAKFFRQWESLLTIEEGDTVLFRELWTMTSTEREKKGRCISHVTIEEGSTYEQKGMKINRFKYTLIRPGPSHANSRPNDSEIGVGEPIVISDEKGHYCLAKGYVEQVNGRKIGVAIDRRLHNARIRLPGFDPTTKQTFSGIIGYGDVNSLSQDFSKLKLPPVLYRIDKDEYTNGMALLRNNLIQIMDNEVPEAARLRTLIIEHQPPKFKANPPSVPLLEGSESLNTDQIAAVEKILSAQDYALVLGMPGTGKTTTIAYIIRALVAQGKSVLLTAYTHTAVDNILLKIRDCGFDILRLGVPSKINIDVQEFAILSDVPRESPEALRDAWLSPPVVACTTLAVAHRIFTLRRFDYCIVDEASQITLPGCLGPIRMARTFVLVGDHFQLPPLVKDSKALEGGLDISLFKLLCESRPDAVVNLEHQYRMCSDIMTLSNSLIYNGVLKCGTEKVAMRSCHIPNPMALEMYHFSHPTSAQCSGKGSHKCHLSKIFAPEVKVLFLNTDLLGEVALESNNGGDRRQNVFEANMLCQILSALLDGGCPSRDIGVVTLYRSQLALLHATMRNGGTFHPDSHFPLGEIPQSAAQLSSQLPSIEMDTADKFQGRDKEIIVVSFVRSNDNGVVGNLLLDHRRVNVAVTRAKSKLILIGSRRTLLTARRHYGDNDNTTPLSQSQRTSTSGIGLSSMCEEVQPDGVPHDLSGQDVLRGLVQLCEQEGWMINLCPKALNGHSFAAVGGQVLRGDTGKSVPDTKGDQKMNQHHIKNENPGAASRKSVPSWAQSSLPSSAGIPLLDHYGQLQENNQPSLRETKSDVDPSIMTPPGSTKPKMPRSFGRIKTETLLKNRPLMRDVYNNLKE